MQSAHNAKKIALQLSGATSNQRTMKMKKVEGYKLLVKSNKTRHPTWHGGTGL
jgi:hypothetical protein